MNLSSRLAGSLLALGLLAGCGSVPNNTPTASDPRLISGYVDRSGQPLICTDTSTPVEFDFTYDGNLQTIQVTLVGLTTGERRDVLVTDVTIAGSNVTLIFDVPIGVAPLGLPGTSGGPGRVGAQGMEPITVDSPHVIGQTRLQVLASSGPNATTRITSNPVPVIDNCA